MMKKSITSKDVCKLLNEMLKLDPKCTRALVSHRQRCNKKILNHKDIQTKFDLGDEYPTVGIVGIINGMFGIRSDGMGAICYEVIMERIVGFKPTPRRRG